MSVRVVARVRPLLPTERAADVIVTTDSNAQDEPLLRIPNPKNENEDFRFRFNGVYDAQATQQDVFEKEVAPTVKHLFNGFDVTLFAYGVTGTGKTHTMRGGKSLADRGVIPRLLSAIYRRCRKVEKTSCLATDGRETTPSRVEVAMSYYEIYNDKVFDLFEPPEKRTPSGLPLRDNNGKTVVVGLTERPCESLKEFECLYDEANARRSTSATKLNAHSSRSHAILCVKVTIITSSGTRTSTASAIDLAGSEDNRRTDNNRERLVESSSINRSLFILAQCVNAISKKQARIPYRESKMTRILSLGQNNGLTIMILNLAPVRAFHLDTLSSLNFANRTKKIEVREVENEPIFKGCPRTAPLNGTTITKRHPLRPLADVTHKHNADARPAGTNDKGPTRPTKAFAVYADRARRSGSAQTSSSTNARASPLKRPHDSSTTLLQRPAKVARPAPSNISQAVIEDMVEKKVNELLATRAMDQVPESSASDISDDVKRRLESLEQRIDSRSGSDSQTDGLSFLLMAKQHQVRGEDGSALKMLQLARPYFPNNAKLAAKIERAQLRLQERHGKPATSDLAPSLQLVQAKPSRNAGVATSRPDDDGEYEAPASEEAEAEQTPVRNRHKARKLPNSTPQVSTNAINLQLEASSPPSIRLLEIVNSQDLAQIRTLRGVGAKKAEAIVQALRYSTFEGVTTSTIGTLQDLASLKGVGVKMVNMRAGLVVEA